MIHTALDVMIWPLYFQHLPIYHVILHAVVPYQESIYPLFVFILSLELLPNLTHLVDRHHSATTQSSSLLVARERDQHVRAD